jgi:hypothetical protein
VRCQNALGKHRFEGTLASQTDSFMYSVCNEQALFVLRCDAACQSGILHIARMGIPIGRPRCVSLPLHVARLQCAATCDSKCSSDKHCRVVNHAFNERTMR